MSEAASPGSKPRPAPSWLWRAGFTVLLIVAALAVCSALMPPVRTAERTAFLLPSFFVQLPLDPTSWFSPPVQQATIDLGGPPGSDAPSGVLHVYRPGKGRHPALIVSLGVDPAPPDNPAVVRLLRGLAQSGIVAVLVQSPVLDAGYISPEGPELQVAAVQTMAGEPYVEADHIGLLGLSVGGSLEMIAAADPRISGRVRLVEAFGSYDSLAAEIRAAVTHSFPVNGREMRWQPDPLAVEVARLNVIALLAEPDEREQLAELFDSGASLPAEPPISLSPNGALAYRLLTASSPAEWDAIYASLPQEARDAIESRSPEAYLHQVRASVFLMVDRDDPYIPYIQSVQIDQALRAAGRRPYFSEFSIFRHVEPTRGGSPLVLLPDVVRLYLHVNAVLGRLF